MDYLTLNRTAWNHRTLEHLDSSFYDVDGFLAGSSSLQEIELADLEVKGKSLLHLQCHFGLDTLSFARMGAKVTGVDLSDTAIHHARRLADACQLTADFVCCDLYEAADRLQQQFDIVYTSYGALCWLPDLSRWAKLIHQSLKPGGQFYMVEFHPVQALMEGYSYFAQQEPDVEEEGTYTENASDNKHTMVTWPHSLADVINALVGAGLRIDAIQEYPFSPYDTFDNLVTGESLGLPSDRPRYYQLHQGKPIPLVYSVSASKPE